MRSNRYYSRAMTPAFQYTIPLDSRVSISGANGVGKVMERIKVPLKLILLRSRDDSGRFRHKAWIKL